MGLCDSCMGEMCHLWHIPERCINHHSQKVKVCENLIGEPWIGKSEKINSVKRVVWKEIGDYCSMRRYNGRKICYHRNSLRGSNNRIAAHRCAFYRELLAQLPIRTIMFFSCAYKTGQGGCICLLQSALEKKILLCSAIIIRFMWTRLRFCTTSCRIRATKSLCLPDRDGLGRR